VGDVVGVGKGEDGGVRVGAGVGVGVWVGLTERTVLMNLCARSYLNSLWKRCFQDV
jgi:hypothetical protein